jgi:putative flippase GtrA
VLKLENYLASQASLAWMRYFLALFCDDYGKLLRFAAVGLIVMAVFMALNAMFGFLMDQQAAFFCAYPPALLLHFSLNKYWAFSNREKISVKQLYTYLITVVITFFIQWLVFTLICRWFLWPAWFVAGLANLAQMLFSFIMMKFRVFDSHRVGENCIKNT